MKFKTLFGTALCGILTLWTSSCALNTKPADGCYTLELLTTNDVHGSWFDSTYVGGKTKKSLFAVNYYVDSVRNAVGEDHVILVDAGDCLQGDNAAYYYNYVDTSSPHLFPRLMDYMDYDAIAVGNHDVETGHHVYDRVAADLKKAGIPFLGGNAVRTDNGKAYFPSCTTIHRQGLKIAILGYTNANMKAWLSEELWSGMDFKSLIPMVQNDVDLVIKKEEPQVIIVAVHSGTGKGDGSIYESQGLDLFKTLRGVDFLVCSHDHSPMVAATDSICLINSGSHCRNVGKGVIHLEIKDGKVISKKLETALIPVNAEKADPVMRAHFQKEYEAVKEFTLKEIGQLSKDIYTKDSFTGMSDYMNLVHTVSLYNNQAQLSFAAPLTFDKKVSAGTLIYNDLFTIYPFENQLFVVKMTGKQIKNYMEYSYDQWINTLPNDHLLKISKRNDKRYGTERWSFDNRSYNFDSTGGLVYTVDVTKPYGSRIQIESMADGSAFDLKTTYRVAMTSYRANGGGNLIKEGAGIDTEHIEDLIVEKLPEIRNIVYDYIVANKTLTPENIGDPKVIGSWKFIPEEKSQKKMKKDMELIFGE